MTRRWIVHWTVAELEPAHGHPPAPNAIGSETRCSQLPARSSTDMAAIMSSASASTGRALSSARPWIEGEKESENRGALKRKTRPVGDLRWKAGWAFAKVIFTLGPPGRPLDRDSRCAH